MENIYSDDSLAELIGAATEVCDEMEYFKDSEGIVRFHPQCEKCRKKCKQSFRVSDLTCGKCRT